MSYTDNKLFSILLHVNEINKCTREILGEQRE